MTARSYLRSFAGGEITPEMFGRLDLKQFQTGAQRLRNFRSLPHGPAENRAGFPFVNEVKDSSKRPILLPFVYSSDQSVVLEFGDQYIRFHALGGTILSASQNISSITNANPGVLGYAGADPTNGQWMYLQSIGGMTELNGRYVRVANVNAGANTFELTDAAGNNINTSSYGAYTSGGTMSPVYEIASPYLEADLYDLHFTQSADVLTITHPSYQQRELARSGATSWALNTKTFAPLQAAPTAVGVVSNAGGGVSYSYVVTAIATDGLEESLASAPGTDATSQDLSAAGAFNTVTWTNAANAVRYNVYRLRNGMYGYVGQSGDGAAGFIDDNIAPDFSQTPPIGNDPFVGADNYPGAVGYHRGRRWFAGTNTKPQNLWGTRSGTESNLSISVPTRDDDAIQVRLTSRRANTIRHIVPLNDMLLLTSGAEWLVTTANSDVLSPTTIDYKVQGDIGASNVQPVVTSESVIYAQARGGRVRELKYKWESQKYNTNDISIMAPHLFRGKTIKQMAFQTGPYPTVWVIRSDGVLLGLTYMPEQEVMAWHQHDTDGEFESVCVVPESDVDALYVTVKRTLQGRTVRTIERQDDRDFTRLQEAVFLDCSASLYNTVAATLTPGTGADEKGTADVVFTAGSSVFTAADVGKFIHYDFEEIDDEGVRQYKTAIGEITARNSGTEVELRIDEAWPDTDVIASGGWRITTTTVSGLWHLEGEEVRVLADGAVHPDVTVSNGRITLEQGASVVHVGKGYKCDFKSMPLVVETAAFGQTIQKNVNRVHLRVYASSGIFAGPSFTKLKEVKQRTIEVYGSPPVLATGRYNLVVEPAWDDDAPICVRQPDPLPLTLVSLAPEVAYGG